MSISLEESQGDKDNSGQPRLQFQVNRFWTGKWGQSPGQFHSREISFTGILVPWRTLALISSKFLDKGQRNHWRRPLEIFLSFRDQISMDPDSTKITRILGKSVPECEFQANRSLLLIPVLLSITLTYPISRIHIWDAADFPLSLRVGLDGRDLRDAGGCFQEGIIPGIPDLARGCLSGTGPNYWTLARNCIAPRVKNGRSTLMLILRLTKHVLFPCTFGSTANQRSKSVFFFILSTGRTR